MLQLCSKLASPFLVPSNPIPCDTREGERGSGLRNVKTKASRREGDTIEERGYGKAGSRIRPKKHSGLGIT
jgi:hypothetical protein